MLKKILIYGILASLVQVMLYYILFFLFWNLGNSILTPAKTDLTSGMLVVFTLYTYIPVIFIQNFAMLFYNKYRITIYVLGFLTFLVNVQDFKEIPLKTVLILLSGLIPMALKYFLETRIEPSLQ